jgi:hypothetical protein
MMEETLVKRYAYAFRAWPDETRKFERAVYHLFKRLDWKVEMVFTPQEFESFRSSLSHHGLTLREIERVPFVEPEFVL